MARGDTLEPLLHGNPLNSTDVDFAALSKGVGHVFVHPELASEALTHRSALDRRPELKAAFPNGNERLEFLGDRVLSLAMADLLLRRFPNEREGELARRHAALVRAETLVEIATEIGLGDHLSLGDSERTPGTNVRPNILADALEALLGAIFLDAGLEAAAASVAVLWGARLSSRVAVPRDPKTAL
jgi:ribonuclease III